MPNILLVYPKFPSLYWGFQFTMDFCGQESMRTAAWIGDGGGIKESGYGRELSYYGIKEFMNIKTVFVK